MAISTTTVIQLSAGSSAEVLAGPGVLTTVMVAEVAGADATVLLTAHRAAEVVYMTLTCRAGETVVWCSSEAVVGSGLDVVCTLGDVYVTVGYY